MKTNRLAAAASTAVMSLGVLVACSPEQGTAPARVNVKTAIFNLAGSLAANGDLIACKTGAAGSFTVVFDAAAAGTRSYDATQVNGTLTPAGTRTFTFNLAAGECKTLYSRPIVGGVGSDPNVRAVITEAAGPTLLSINVNDDGSGNEATSNVATRSATLQFNMFHDALATFNNQPPTTGCTFTQGYYKNHESVVSTLLSVNGGYVVNNKLVVSADGTISYTAAQIDAILGTPPQGGNAELILLHQLITAELNIKGGASVPAPVLAAINSARTLMNGGISAGEAAQAIALAAILDDYNNGITGPGHCD